jgi:hypothetical protein
MSSFSESFIPSGKRSGTAVLGEGHDIVTGETCVPATLNINNLGKTPELHLTFLLSSVDETVPNLSLHKHLRKSRCSASYVLIGFSYSALHPPSSFLGSMGFKL